MSKQSRSDYFASREDAEREMARASAQRKENYLKNKTKSPVNEKDN